MVREVSREDIRSARSRTHGYIRRTPVLDLGPILSEDWDLTLKLEQVQVTGSFKARGAFNTLLNEDIATGVVAASGGNFGKAVAYVASTLGVPATIFVPDSSPEEKTGQIDRYGADLHLVGGHYDAALDASRRFAEATGQFLAHAYDQHSVMSGQGTVAAEIGEQVAGVTSILVPVGGGGLIGGVASWFHEDVAVIGVEPETCPTLFEARAQGCPVDVEVGGVAVSSLGARRVGEYPWLANKWIDNSVLVNEASIIESQLWLWDNCRVWVEPSAAVTVAALQTAAYVPNSGERVVALLSGANVALGHAT